MASKSRAHAAARVIPLGYRVCFLYIEPLTALAGAYFAFFQQQRYLELTHAESATSQIPLGVSVSLSQLANLYLLFALVEALVLRSTSELSVWRAVLFSMCVADIGHLYSVKPLGVSQYWSL